MFAEFFGGEMFNVPLVYVVDCLAEEVYVPIYFHGVQKIIGGVFWGGYVVRYRSFWSL